MSDIREHDYLCKVLIIGDAGVGKSCLQVRYTDDTFSDSYIHTIGVEFRIKTVEVDGKLIKMQLWDTAGQERFRSITTSFYRGAHGIIIVYDVTKKKSFDNLHGWLEDVARWTYRDVSKLLIGNKCDLTEEREVDYHTAKDYADRCDIPLVETSAKDSTNVEQAFIRMAITMRENIDSSDPTHNQQKVKLNGGNEIKSKSCC